MQLGILKTDGGPHPPDKWARMTARMIVSQIVQIDENSLSPQAVEMRTAVDELEAKLRKMLVVHHAMVQSGERAALGKEGSARLSKPCRRSPDARNAAVKEHVSVDDVVAAVVAEAKIHPMLFAHFNQDEVRAVITERLNCDFGTALVIERSWHADGATIAGDGRAKPRGDHNPSDPHVAGFKQRGAPGANPTIDTSPKALGTA